MELIEKKCRCCQKTWKALPGSKAVYHSVECALIHGHYIKKSPRGRVTPLDPNSPEALRIRRNTQRWYEEKRKRRPDEGYDMIVRQLQEAV